MEWIAGSSPAMTTDGALEIIARPRAGGDPDGGPVPDEHCSVQNLTSSRLTRGPLVLRGKASSAGVPSGSGRAPVNKIAPGAEIGLNESVAGQAGSFQRAIFTQSASQTEQFHPDGR